MKRQFRVVATIIGLLSATPAFAFFGTVSDHILLLTSSDSFDVKSGAESVFDRYGGNRTLIDVAAARLHAELLAQQGERLEEDTVAWLAKAVGGSGSRRYAAVLSDAQKHGRSRTQYWAELGIRRMWKSDEVIRSEEIDLAAIRAGALERVAATNIELQERLRVSNSKLVRQTAERAFFLAAYVDEYTLNEARRLLREDHLTKDIGRVQALGWLCRLLGRAGDSSDIELLTLVAKEVRGNLRRHAREAISKLRG